MNQELFRIFRDHATKVAVRYELHPELDRTLTNRGRIREFVVDSIAERIGDTVMEFAPIERVYVDDETVAHAATVYVLTSDGMRALLDAIDRREP